MCRGCEDLFDMPVNSLPLPAEKTLAAFDGGGLVALFAWHATATFKLVFDT